MILKQRETFDVPSISLSRETRIREREKQREREIVRESRFQSASFCFLDFLELIPIASPTLQHPPFTRLFSLSYSRAVLPLFAPEGNTEHLLREIKKKRLSGKDARLRSTLCIRRRNDNSSHRILAFLIY